ncbi:hypothetical protein FEE95_21865 [Maribacter algarum]|uniref:Uncharacterized protein n=1 Tax=Maribacter algarum (ex Zhang et al. 2020) TaxID=2578118 RepID=A0A5S3PCG2_9FLAO|nr:hypothetical protein FEE95_21865 [Maribacter algarum]
MDIARMQMLRMDFLASLRRWTLLMWKRDGNAKVRAYSDVKLQKITKPINNTGLGLNHKVCVFL